MGDNGLVVPKQYRHKGTRIVPLPALSAAEGRPAFAQIRALQGRQFYLLVQRPGFKGFDKPKNLTDDQLAKLGVEATEHSRAIVLPGTIRLLLLGAPVEAYRVVDKPVGEHGADEVSIDAFEHDFPVLGKAIMELSVPQGAEAGAPPSFRGGGTGSPGHPGPAG
jgi:hypothetical protein